MSSSAPAKPPPREQLLIESEVQTSLLLRVALYGCALGVYFTVIQFFSQLMQAPNASFQDMFYGFMDEAIYWGPGLMLLGPLCVYDLLTQTNRFAGPVFRLRREMERLANHKSAGPLEFRDEDFWRDLGEHFNLIRDELLQLREDNQKLRKAAASAATPSPTAQMDSETEAMMSGMDAIPTDDKDAAKDTGETTIPDAELQTA